MKKLLVLLLISVLAAFVFTSCTVPNGGEGEGEGEVESVEVIIDGIVTIDGKDYVGPGNHDITIKFPAPVANAFVSVSDCTGDYSKANGTDYTPVVLWPVDDAKTEWSGSINFTCTPCYTGDCVEYSNCCASYIWVEAGECDWCEYAFPVIVDCAPPEVDLGVRFVDCGDPCDPCDDTRAVSMEWTSMVDPASVCDDPTDCCEDDCSGIASWTMTVGGTVCDEPCDIIPGEDCPVEGVSECCLYYATEAQGEVCYNITFNIVDKVGNTWDTNYVESGSTSGIQPFTWKVCLDTDEVVSFVSLDGISSVSDFGIYDTDTDETVWMGVEITGICAAE